MYTNRNKIKNIYITNTGVAVMKNIRTDLALEARELWQEGAKEKTKLEGVVAREMKINGL